MDKLLIFLSFLLVSILIISGCRKITDIENIELGDVEPEFAIPLFKTKTNLNDALANLDDNTFITIQDDGLVVLNYKGDVLSRSTQDIFDIISGAFIPVEDTLINYYFDLPSSIDLHFAELTNGKVLYAFRSYHEQDVDVTMTFPQLIKDGEEFTMHHHVDYVGDTPVTALGFYDTGGYTLTSNNNDTITFRYEAILEDGTRDTVSNMLITLSELEFDYIQGYLGEDIYELPRDTIEIDFFENWTQGNISFVDPLIKITVMNSFGFPVRSQVDFINVLTVNGEVLPLESPYIDNLYIDYPQLDEVGETKTSTFIFNNENSNIAEILGSGPVAVDYLLNALPNPDTIETIVGFATDSSVFAVQVEVELPLHGAANDFLAFDTITVDTFDLAADFSEEENIKNAEFKLITENSLPLSVELQVLFADEAGETIDQLFSEATRFIEAAAVDEEGEVLNKVEKTFFINVDADRFERLKKTRQLFLRYSFSTTNGGEIPIRIKAEQELAARMGVRFIYNN